MLFKTKTCIGIVKAEKYYFAVINIDKGISEFVKFDCLPLDTKVFSEIISGSNVTVSFSGYRILHFPRAAGQSDPANISERLSALAPNNDLSSIQHRHVQSGFSRNLVCTVRQERL
ncbi:MAG: hypothetical protein AB1633_05510, partial [Elusimicrobiota bacterium]